MFPDSATSRATTLTTTAPSKTLGWNPLLKGTSKRNKIEWNFKIWYQLEKFPSFYSTALRGFWRLYLNPPHQVDVNQSVSSCDCRSWIRYLPTPGYIRLSSPKQWILEMARACATQSQVLTMFEVKLKIQPLSRSQTRQATTAAGYRGYGGKDAQACAQQDTTLYHRCFLTLPATSVQRVSWNFLQIFSYFTFILKDVLPTW